MRAPRTETNVLRTIAGPVVVSIAVTLLRLAGERLHWSPAWFSPETGGIFPSGTRWVVGITWLPVPFGLYFAARLLRSSQGPKRRYLPLASSLSGLAFIFAFAHLPFSLPLAFPRVLVLVWLVMIVAAAHQFYAWRSLAKILLAYGLVSRAFVAIVMFLAMRGEWGTHYDYVGMPPEFHMSFWPRFLWLAFFPQLVF